MTETPTLDSYEPGRDLDGPPRAEDEAYLFEKARQYRQELREVQAQEIADAHRLLVLRGERDRALERMAIIVLGAAARGAGVHEQVERLLAMDAGARVLVDTAVRLIRLLGADHGDEIRELLDAMKRLAEGEM